MSQNSAMSPGSGASLSPVANAFPGNAGEISNAAGAARSSFTLADFGSSLGSDSAFEQFVSGTSRIGGIAAFVVTIGAVAILLV